MFNFPEQEEFLNGAVDAIRTTLAATFGREVGVVPGPPHDPLADAVLVLEVEKPAIAFDLELKAALNPSAVTIISKRHAGGNPMVITARLTPATMAACRQLGVGCADLDGNLFIRSSTTAIDIEGRPVGASREFSSRSPTSRLTSRSSLQVLLVLLAFADLPSKPYRNIAVAADVSVGSVASVFEDLADQGHVGSGANGRTLRNCGVLADTWTEGYRQRLLPKLQLGTFSTEERQWWRTYRTRATGMARGQWSGETAIWALDGNLRPARGVLYVEAVPPRLVRDLKLKRDTSRTATVDFRRRFWTAPDGLLGPTVPSLLVYADLIADGDPRLLEAATEFRRTDGELQRLDQT